MNGTEISERFAEIEWDDPRSSHRQSRDLLRYLAEDRELLTELVSSIQDDPWRMKRSECHPIMNKLCLLETPDSPYQLRLHDFRVSDLDIVPHDHKYSFSVYILAGGYTHVWNRRTNGIYDGDFTSQDIAPGLVSLEGPGSCYTLQYSLVHQTIAQPNTVSLFLRGPKRMNRWHAARDMMHLFKDYEAPKEDGTAHQGSIPMSTNEFMAITTSLASRGIIADRSPIDVVS
jgi:hypothetical protein